MGGTDGESANPPVYVNRVRWLSRYFIERVRKSVWWDVLAQERSAKPNSVGVKITPGSKGSP